MLSLPAHNHQYIHTKISRNYWRCEGWCWRCEGWCWRCEGWWWRCEERCDVCVGGNPYLPSPLLTARDRQSTATNNIWFLQYFKISLSLLCVFSCFLMAKCLISDMIWKTNYHRIKMRHSLIKPTHHVYIACTDTNCLRRFYLYYRQYMCICVYICEQCMCVWAVAMYVWAVAEEQPPKSP